MQLIYTQFEVYDSDVDQTIATVSMVDEAAATVEITAVQNVRSWRELSVLVEAALKQMSFVGDEK